jgi:hypothetical protein
MSNFYLYLSIAIIVVIVIAAIFSKLSPQPKWKDDAVKKINEISKIFNSTKEPMILSSLLIESDKLLDHALKMSGTKGNTMGERLKSAKNRFDRDSYHRVWEAHKLRNRIAHEQNVTFKTNEIKIHIGALLTGTRKLL